MINDNQTNPQLNASQSFEQTQSISTSVPVSPTPTPTAVEQPLVDKKPFWQEIAWGWVISTLLGGLILIMLTSWVTKQVHLSMTKQQVQQMLALTQQRNAQLAASKATETEMQSTNVSSWRQQQSSTRLDQSCQWLGTRELVVELDGRAAEIENNYTFSLPDETAVQYWRDFWWWAGDDANERCQELKDCRHVFADDVPFVLAYERRRYQTRHSRHEKYDEFIPEVAEAEILQTDAEVDFGVAVDDLRTFLPASVYNVARQEVQLLEVAEAPQQPWTWHLQEVRTDTDSGEIVLIADSEASSECQLVDGPVHCSCPQASYYLVGRKNEDSDELQYVEEFVRVWGQSEPVVTVVDDGSIT